MVSMVTSTTVDRGLNPRACQIKDNVKKQNIEHQFSYLKLFIIQICCLVTKRKQRNLSFKMKLDEEAETLY